MGRKILFIESIATVAVVWRGRLTGRDIADALREIYNDKRWSDAHDTVWIYDELELLEVTPEEVSEVCGVESQHTMAASTGCDVAVVKRELDEMMAHFFVAMAARTPAIRRRKGAGGTIEQALAAVGLDTTRAAIIRAAVAGAVWDREEDCRTS